MDVLGIYAESVRQFQPRVALRYPATDDRISFENGTLKELRCHSPIAKPSQLFQSSDQTNATIAQGFKANLGSN
jgi:hypothetical protein